MFEQTFPSNNEQKLATDFSGFMLQMKSLYLQPMIDIKKNLRTNTILHYDELMQYVKQESQYFAQPFIYDTTSEMRLWMDPMPNLNNPPAIKDEGTQFWKVWDRSIPTDQFITAPPMEKITELVNAYFSKLDKELDIFSRRHTEYQHAIDDRIKKIERKYEDLKEELELGSDFVE